MENDKNDLAQQLKRTQLDKQQQIVRINELMGKIDDFNRQIHSLKENIDNLKKQNQNDRNNSMILQQKLKNKIKQTVDRSQMEMEDNFMRAMKHDQMVMTLTNRLEEFDLELQDEKERYEVLVQKK